jgi:mono/diheme cytochrome c family protein
MSQARHHGVDLRLRWRVGQLINLLRMTRVYTGGAIAAALLVLLNALASAAPGPRTGEQIYRADCVRCHGPSGEGVADKCDEPLSGDRSAKSLARLIAKTMPEDRDEKCSPDEAGKVAEYIYDAFYSPAARARNQPARIQLARLTVPQYLNSVADLVGSFREQKQIDNGRGLAAEYYNARNFREQKQVVERIDPKVEFNFANGSPDTNKIEAKEFAIRWRGSVMAEETGDYEFCLKTENGARLWVNGESKQLIDGWVSSGGKVREERAAIRLLGGRAYPMQVDFFKYKDKTASITLQWKPPHKTWETIPARHLAPVRTAETLVIGTSFPADDSSVGYPRGTAVSKAWDQATTYAAIEVANKMVEDLDVLTASKASATNRVESVRRFCEQFAERAFRRPLTEKQKRLFIEQQFKGAKDLETAVKQVVLVVLKSPRFLYPELPGEAAGDYDVSARLALHMWDSIPDRELLTAAGAGQLRTVEQIGAQAQRMLKDRRAKWKVEEFFRHWLEMEEAEDISKDAKTFPDFSDLILTDLRTSLELFIGNVVWSDKADYRELLLADYLFLNARLAKFYGVAISGEEEFEKISFSAQERSGVVTHPYLLSAFAYHKSSSPIHRGVFLTRNIVGRALKPPPMAIEFMDGRFDPSLTMREKVAELTRPAACQTCHSVINPLGFSLENYDAVGRYRTVDNKKPVDATGEYTTAEGKPVKLSGARDVAEYAATSAEAHRGFIQQLFHHMVKQPAAAYGANSLEALRRSFAASEFNVQKLVVEIAKLSALPPKPAVKPRPGTPAGKRET